MPTWTIDQTEQLIRDQEGETFELEFKSADALRKNNTKKSEIAKDVSA